MPWGGLSLRQTLCLFACYIVKTMVAFVSFSGKMEVFVTKNGANVPLKHNISEYFLQISVLM